MLHDQSIVAGIGNIYSDEILFAARNLSGSRSVRIWKIPTGTDCSAKVKEVIAWGVDVNKMTPEEYLAGKGKEYRNIPYLRVYGRLGQHCGDCGTIIEKITIGGRSSCFCPVCQKKL